MTINIAIDFETYYGTGCDITKLGMSQYIKHPEFEVQTMAYMTRHMETPKVLIGHDRIAEFFDQIRPEAKHFTLSAHNVAFDGFVASHHFDFIPTFYYCTASMARAVLQQYCGSSLKNVAKFLGVSPKIEGVLENVRNVHLADMSIDQLAALAEYNQADVVSHVEILRMLLPGFPADELKVIDLTTRMFTEPVLEVDTEAAKAIVEAEKQAKIEALEKAGITAKQAGSSDQFFEVLKERGYDPPVKWSVPKAEYIPALAKNDISFIRMREGANDELNALIDARLAVKSTLMETRAQAFLDRAGDPVPVSLLYCAAHTMRFGGSDKINLQNLPANALRSCLRAPKGHRLVIVDAAQIEARINAWLAGQDDLVAAFAAGEDVYALFASELFGTKVTKDSHPQERYIGKTCILGLGYQMGPQRLKDELLRGRGGPPLDLDLSACSRFVHTYRQRYDKIPEQWYALHALLYNLLPHVDEVAEYRMLTVGNTKVQMPNGLALHYPNMEIKFDQESGHGQYQFWPYKARKGVKMFGGKFTENIVQCLARIITTGHMLALSERWKVVLMAHDEVVLCVPEAKAQDALNESLTIMAEPPDWAAGLPLATEGKILDSYGK